jgi:propanol-preferring alcohol dehydrogenase
VGVFGVGGLGAYAVQYAKLLGAGATVVAFARSEEKLAIARKYGADHTIAIRGKTADDVAKELKTATGQNKLDAIIDCVGAPEMIRMGFALLGISGHYADVGFVGDRIDVPLFPRVSGEQTFHGSFWGNNADLSEVMALAAEGKIQHTIQTIGFEQINEYLDLLRDNKVVGRTVVKF